MTKRFRRSLELFKAWEVKATTLKKLNDREEMDFSGFIGNLKTHEMKMKVREQRETTKKKAIAFKAIPATIDEEDSSEDSDEDFAMLIRKWARCFIKKEDKATFKEEDIKKDLKRKRRWVFTFIARRRAI